MTVAHEQARFTRRQCLAGAAAGAWLGWTGPSHGQDMDSARVLCGFPPGGTTDAVSRRLADKLRGALARSVIVENKPGAGGRLAVEELKRSSPDGTSMLLTPASMITLYPHVYLKLGYGIDDVTPVCTACTVEFGFGVGPLVPEHVHNLKDFLRWAKEHPEKSSYASPGAGSPPHFLGALLAKESGLDLRHVPYRGSAPGIQDLLGGQVASMSSPIGDYLPHLRGGKLRLLATSGARRSRFTPEVATYGEQGFSNLEMREWYGVFLPAKAAPGLAQQTAAAIRTAVAALDVGEAFAALGLEPSANTPAELAASVRSENQAWGPIVKRVGFTPEA